MEERGIIFLGFFILRRRRVGGLELVVGVTC